MIELLLIGVVIVGIVLLFTNTNLLQNVANVFLGTTPETEGYSITDDEGAVPTVAPHKPFKFDDYQAPKVTVVPPTDQIFRVENPELADISIDEIPVLDTLTPLELERLRARFQAKLEETI